MSKCYKQKVLLFTVGNRSIDDWLFICASFFSVHSIYKRSRLMTFIFLPINNKTAVNSMQGNLTRVHHRLKRNDNDHYHHHRETIISTWWERKRWHHQMKIKAKTVRQFTYICRCLTLHEKWLFVKRLSWLESISVVFVFV